MPTADCGMSKVMATAPLITPNIHIIPLAEADLAGLEQLFDEQCGEWLELLGWDYSGPSRLIRDVVREKELSGFVAVAGAATIGFAFYVVEAERCSIGDIYIAKPWRSSGADRQLAVALLQKIDSMPRLRRLESQSVNIENHEIYSTFEAYGFRRFDRNYMMIQAADWQAKIVAPEANPAPHIFLRPWEDEDFGQAARVIRDSYIGTLDSDINNQYCSEEGCADLLAVLTEHLWCGHFLRHLSRVAIDRTTRRMIGVLIASRISPGVGHISQISVRPLHQGQGIGRHLIQVALADFFDLGFRLVSLAVTRENANALHLYETCGFRTVHAFPVFYLNK